MTEMIKIIGVAFITTIAAILLRITKPELSFAVTVTGVIVILIFIVDAVRGTLTIFTTITEMTGVDNGLMKLLLKFTECSEKMANTVACPKALQSLSAKVCMHFIQTQPAEEFVL